MTTQKRLEHDLLVLLEEALENAGWALEKSSPGVNLMTVSPSGERFYVEMKASPRLVRRIMEGTLARTSLIAQRNAKAYDARPLAIVAAESISEAMKESLREFAELYLEKHIAYGILDAGGRIEIHRVPDFQDVRSIAPLPYHAPPEHSVRRQPVFSDLGQWMLKVLLARYLDPLHLTAPREPPANAQNLARLANVSVPTAYRFVNAAIDLGHVEASRGRISVVSPLDLLRIWQQNPMFTTAETRAKWILTKRDPYSALKKVLSSNNDLDASSRPAACLGLFAAADQLGLGFVEGVPPHLLLRDVSAPILERYGLREAESAEHADVLIRQPECPESTFRGAVCRDGVWATDVLQTWLDTVDHEARGTEQAEHIHQVVFSKAFPEADE